MNVSTALILLPVAGDPNPLPPDGSVWFNGVTGQLRKKQHGVVTDWDAAAGGDPFLVSTALRTAVVQGTYDTANNLTTVLSVAGSAIGMRFKWDKYEYTFMPDDSGNLNWVRNFNYDRGNLSPSGGPPVEQSLASNSATAVPSVRAVRAAIDTPPRVQVVTGEGDYHSYDTLAEALAGNTQYGVVKLNSGFSADETGQADFGEFTLKCNDFELDSFISTPPTFSATKVYDGIIAGLLVNTGYFHNCKINGIQVSAGGLLDAVDCLLYLDASSIAGTVTLRGATQVFGTPTFVGTGHIQDLRYATATNPGPVRVGAGLIAATDGTLSVMGGGAGTPEIKNYPALAQFPAPGDPALLYIADDTNRQYRWTGSAYALLSDSGLTAAQLAAFPAGVSATNKLVASDDPRLSAAPVARQLTFEYPAGTANDAFELVLPAKAGPYGTEALGNVATHTYYLNGTAQALPFTTAATDTVRCVITRTDTTRGAYVILTA